MPWGRLWGVLGPSGLRDTNRLAAGVWAEARSAEGASTGAPIVNHHAEEHTSPHWVQQRALTYFWRRARAGRAST